VIVWGVCGESKRERARLTELTVVLLRLYTHKERTSLVIVTSSTIPRFANISENYRTNYALASLHRHLVP
jgi:hypothetical protein